MVIRIAQKKLIFNKRSYVSQINETLQKGVQKFQRVVASRASHVQLVSSNASHRKKFENHRIILSDHTLTCGNNLHIYAGLRISLHFP